MAIRDGPYSTTMVNSLGNGDPNATEEITPTREIMGLSTLSASTPTLLLSLLLTLGLLSLIVVVSLVVAIMYQRGLFPKTLLSRRPNRSSRAVTSSASPVTTQMEQRSNTDTMTEEIFFERLQELLAHMMDGHSDDGLQTNKRIEDLIEESLAPRELAKLDAMPAESRAAWLRSQRCRLLRRQLYLPRRHREREELGSAPWYGGPVEREGTYLSPNTIAEGLLMAQNGKYEGKGMSMHCSQPVVLTIGPAEEPREGGCMLPCKVGNPLLARCQKGYQREGVSVLLPEKDLKELATDERDVVFFGDLRAFKAINSAEVEPASDNHSYLVYHRAAPEVVYGPGSTYMGRASQDEGLVFLVPSDAEKPSESVSDPGVVGAPGEQPPMGHDDPPDDLLGGKKEREPNASSAAACPSPPQDASVFMPPSRHVDCFTVSISSSTDDVTVRRPPSPPV